MGRPLGSELPRDGSAWFEGGPPADPASELLASGPHSAHVAARFALRAGPTRQSGGSFRPEPGRPFERDNRTHAGFHVEPRRAAEKFGNARSDRQVEPAPLGGRADQTLEEVRVERVVEMVGGGDFSTTTSIVHRSAGPFERSLTGASPAAATALARAWPIANRTRLGSSATSAGESGANSSRTALYSESRFGLFFFEQLRQERGRLELDSRGVLLGLDQPAIVAQLSQHLLDLLGVLLEERHVLFELGARGSGPIGRSPGS